MAKTDKWYLHPFGNPLEVRTLMDSNEKPEAPVGLDWSLWPAPSGWSRYVPPKEPDVLLDTLEFLLQKSRGLIGPDETSRASLLTKVRQEKTRRGLT